MTVSTLVILGLAVVWAIVLLPEAIKKVRASSRTYDSVASFSRSLSHLERSNPRVRRGTAARSNVVDLGQHRRDSARPAARPSRPAGAPAMVSPAVRRRRQEVLTALVAATLLTLVCTIAFGSFFLVPHLVADVLLVAYVLCLHQVTNQGSIPASATHHASRRPAVRTPRPDELHGATVARVSPARVRGIAN